MKIGYDGKRAVANLTGLGNYSRLVLESISEEYPDDDLVVFAPRRKDNPRLATLLERPNVSFVYPEKHGVLHPAALWRSYGISSLLRPMGIELYHGLSNELPLNISKAGIPSVVTIHDVIYRRLPECYTRADRFFCDFKYGRACREATRIIAISERTKLDIVHYYHIDPERIDVVYQGCDDSFKKERSIRELVSTRKKYGITTGRYILQVGTIEKRKNLELTVRALSAVPADVNLVVVGKDRLGYKARVERIAREVGVADRIVYLDSVPFADLPALCQAASVIAYPSRYEGFGIPVLEGLASQRPVVAATGSCLEEAGGDAAIYVDPDDARGMGEALNAIFSSTADVGAMIARGLEHLSRFDNRRIASTVIDVYHRAIRDYRERSR